MNIYELETARTPGPWATHPVCAGNVNLIRAGYGTHAREWAIASFHTQVLQSDVNAHFTTHCCNHFLEALEALKRVRALEKARPGFEYRPSLDYIEFFDEGILDALITELETVEDV